MGFDKFSLTKGVMGYWLCVIKLERGKGMRMGLVSLILCLPALGQMRLKAGCYTDLKPTEAIVLDTGCYTFIGLEMEPPQSPAGGLWKRVWLDARKAQKLELLHCTFEGKGVGTAVLSSGDLSVSHCRFTKMKEGILQASPPGSKRKVTITNNLFRDNLVSVRLEVESMSRITNPTISVRHYKCRTAGADVNFTLQCNNFEQTTAITSGQRFGLRIGEEVSLPNNRIGGDGSPGMDEVPPNSNSWPRVGNSTDPPPTNFTNYVSIQNESSSQVKYWRYHNEHLGLTLPSLAVKEEYLPEETYVVNEATISNFCDLFSSACSFSSTGACEAGIVAGSASLSCTGNVQWVRACAGGVLDEVLFPVYKPVTDTSQQAQITAQQQRFGTLPFLGQSIPNPGSGKVLIPLYLPWNTEKAVLVFTEMATGRKIMEVNVDKKGDQILEVETGKWPAGIYNYRLELKESEIPKPMKMVIIH